MTFEDVGLKLSCVCFSPSFFNPEEVVTVCNYIQKLLELKNPRIQGKDIGVISPYRKQISKIKDALNTRVQKDKAAFSNKAWKDITVASCEEFQVTRLLVYFYYVPSTHHV